MSMLKALKSILKHTSGFTKSDSVKGFAGQHPLAALGLVAPSAGFLAEDVVAPLAKGAYEASPLHSIIKEAEDQRLYERGVETRNQNLATQLKSRRMEEMVQRNMAAVAQYSPHLYNQVMSGRLLPEGAVVLGGPRRQDLMEELAHSMGSSSSPENFESLLSQGN